MDWKNVGNYFKGAVTTEKDAEGNSTGQIKNPELLLGGISVVDLFLGSAANNMRYGNVTDPALKEMLQAVYGDANEDPLMRLYGVINGSAMKEATGNISNQGNLIGSGVSSNLLLLEQSKNIYQANHLERDKFGMDNVADNFSAFGKGFTNGLEMSGGNIWAALAGGIAGGLANIGTQAGNNKRIEAMNRALDLAQAQSSFNFQQSVDSTAKLNTLNLLANMAAYGGFLRRYDLGGSLGDFNEVNAGGTHELNPLGGVMVRPDASVELGETITDTNNGDYVFSDRLKLSKQECLDLGIPVGSTYAKASKILRKEYDERPNDPISKKGWEDFKNILIESQELQKQEKALKEARKQGLNSPKMQGVNPQAMLSMQYSENPQEEALLQQGINPNIQQAFGGYTQYGPGGFLEKILNLMRSPEMRHAMSNANMARLMRNYENNTKVLGITENKYSEENGIPISEINMNNLLTTPQGDSTWMYNNERINGGNSLFNSVNVINNPLTGNYTYETYNDATGNRVFEEEIPRNELPQEVLNVMNYDYSGNKEYRRGGYVRKFAGGSFLNPDDPPSDKYTYKLTTSDGSTYIYENVPADVYLQMVGNTNFEDVDIDAVFNHANNPKKEWDLYLNADKSKLPEGYVVNKPTTALSSMGNITIDPEFGMMAEPTYVIDTPLSNSSDKSPVALQGSENSSSLREASPWFTTNQSPVVNNSGSSSVFQPIIPELNWPTVTRDIVTPMGTVDVLDKIDEDLATIKAAIAEREALKKSTDNTGNTNDNLKTFDLEKLRYAPVLGNLAAAIKNTFTKPDYKYANRLDLMALRINTNIPTPGNYNYMTYNPVDTQRYLNNYNAQANAARQGIMNTTNPSRNAALLAAQYNDLSGRGDLMQSIDLVNKNHYNDVIVRNNAVNAQRNADALNIANANFTRQQYLLGLMQQANALRQAEDEGLRAARAQQWSNAFSSLGAVGQEALADKQANRWFELSKLAPGLTFEQYNNILDGKASLAKQDDGTYKYTENS